MDTDSYPIPLGVEELAHFNASRFLVIDLHTGRVVRMNDPDLLFVYRVGGEGRDTVYPLTQRAVAYAEKNVRGLP